jgi:phospholipid transport system substrate-binding protein
MSEHRDMAPKFYFLRWSVGFALAMNLLAGLMITLGSTADTSSARAATVAANSAEAFVQQNIDQGYSILNAKLSESDRHRRFRTFLAGFMDARRIGIFTLGQYANSSSKADIDAFIAAFTDYTVDVYDRRLNKYKDQILKVTGSSARAADDVVVNSEATDPAHPNNPPYKVAFRIRKAADGRFILTDLNVEGVWQSISQRAEFTAFLQQHAGNIQELTNYLKHQTQLQA